MANTPEDLCDYCRMTDYGSEKVNTGPHNLCEGICCAEALDRYKEDNPDDGDDSE